MPDLRKHRNTQADITRVAQALRTRLTDGTYPPGTWLPSLRALMAEFGVTNYAVQLVINRLIVTELVKSIPSAGTYVIDPADPAAVPAGRPGGKTPTRRNRVEEILRARITDGTYTVGTKIPSHARLSEELGIPEWTVQQAVGRLADAGLLVTVRRRGTVVTDPRVPSDGSAQRVRAEAVLEGTGTGPRPGLVSHIRAVLRKRLTDGTYPPGTVLPTLTALAEEFCVSRGAVNGALRPLRQERLVVLPVPGKGLFAAPATERRPSSGAVPDLASAWLPRAQDPSQSTAAHGSHTAPRVQDLDSLLGTEANHHRHPSFPDRTGPRSQPRVDHSR
jgi:DNA-binding GntR family transcriptional regulator